MKKLLIGVFTLLVASAVHAGELDVLMARTALALGDEYAKLATKYQQNLSSLMEQNPGIIIANKADLPPEYFEVEAKYLSYLGLAKSEYNFIICEVGCEAPLAEAGLELPETYSFLKREAHVKYDQLSLGSNLFGTIGRTATVYAVNSSFEEHLLGKLTKLVENQQRLDQEARKLSNTYIQLKNAFIQNETDVIGVEQQILRESNYDLDTQSQISGYQACIDTQTIEDNFEKDELANSLKQHDILIRNIRTHFEKVYDTTYETPGGDEIVTVAAKAGWQDTGITFNAGDKIYVSAQGKWNVRGAMLLFQDTHLYFSPATPEGLNKGLSCCRKLFKSIKSIVNPVISFATNVINAALGKQAKIKLAKSNKEMVTRIQQGLDTPVDGYHFSFSSGASAGSSSGSSFSITGTIANTLSIGGSQSVGSSSGVSAGTGGTYGLKLETAVMKEAPIGSLIGSFCDTAPDGVSCPFFIVGQGNFFEIPGDIGTKKLWLRANEHPTNFNNNSGTAQVRVQKQTKFLSYYSQYAEWFDADCDEDGYGCGLGVILENIAFTPNPYTVARASFVKQFPDFPEEVTNLIMQEVNYFIEVLIGEKELKAKELSRELSSVKIANCRDQLAASQEKLLNTKELISTYERREQSLETTRVLLDTSRNYYESELASLNNIREKNLERIRRYHALTVSSYNYLYLDNFKVEGIPQPYFEGDFYKAQIDLMEDLILEITTVNDLLNPNRGFIVYQLSPDELAALQNPDYRNRKTQIKLDYNNFFCQGFNLENQARVMVEKVGLLLDIDPTREHLFFKNANQRNTQVQVSHGLENVFYGFSGNLEEFWMPAQKRNVAGHSTRVLVDANSDYFQLRDSRFFERLSFRKSSFATTWQLDMLDPAIRMYEASDTEFTNPILQGAKFVVWYNSSEMQSESGVNACLTPPTDVSGDVGDVSLKPEIAWQYTKDDPDFLKTQRFTIYKSTQPEHGFKAIGHTKASDCADESDHITCAFEDSESENGNFYYQVKASYASGKLGEIFMDGLASETINVNHPL